MPIPSNSDFINSRIQINSSWPEKIARWIANGNNTSISAIGAAALTVTGTATATSVVGTTFYNSIRKIEALVTVAATTAVAGYRNTVAQRFYGGVAAGSGGFYHRSIGGPATGVATTTHRFFMGLANSTTAPTDVEPSSITNILGIGYDAADTNVQFMYRGAGAVTKVDLGGSFAVPTTDRSTIYQLVMSCKPGTTQALDWHVTNITSGATASGSITTGGPSTTTTLAERIWASVGGTSSVIGIAFSDIETSSNW